MDNSVTWQLLFFPLNDKTLSNSRNNIVIRLGLLYVHTICSPQGMFRSLALHQIVPCQMWVCYVYIQYVHLEVCSDCWIHTRHCPAICDSVICTYSMLTSRCAQIAGSTPTLSCHMCVCYVYIQYVHLEVCSDL